MYQAMGSRGDATPRDDYSQIIHAAFNQFAKRLMSGHLSFFHKVAREQFKANGRGALVFKLQSVDDYANKPSHKAVYVTASALATWNVRLSEHVRKYDPSRSLVYCVLCPLPLSASSIKKDMRVQIDFATLYRQVRKSDPPIIPPTDRTQTMVVVGRKCFLPACNNKESSSGHFRACGKCRFALYCSTTCQKAHWDVHRADCSEARGVAPPRNPARGEKS